MRAVAIGHSMKTEAMRSPPSFRFHVRLPTTSKPALRTPHIKLSKHTSRQPPEAKRANSNPSQLPPVVKGQQSLRDSIASGPIALYPVLCLTRSTRYRDHNPLEGHLVASGETSALLCGSALLSLRHVCHGTLISILATCQAPTSRK